MKMPPIPDDGPEFTTEVVCFVPTIEPPGRPTGLGRLATCIAEDGCTVDWHIHLLRVTRSDSQPDSEVSDG